MCKRRIRVPEQWYGDHLACIGSARIGERRLIELTKRYGAETIKAFINEWFAYSERRMVDAIRRLPAGRMSSTSVYDPMPPVLPEGLPIRVDIEVQPDAGRIIVDLRHNADNVDCGLNESLACATSNAMCGVFNCMEPDIPHNAGSFARIDVLLREGCVAGVPRFPTSCSVATTNIGDRIVNATQSAFSLLQPGIGAAEGAMGFGAAGAVISGHDRRRNGPYVNQEWMVANGGPATDSTDGWLNFGIPVAAGMLYRGSVEVDESKFPILFESLRVIEGGGGAGRRRGSPGVEVAYGPRFDPMTLVMSCDGQVNPARGAQGGLSGPPASTRLRRADGSEEVLPGAVQCALSPGEVIIGRDGGGGGYGDPLEREPERVLRDVAERWESRARAREIYGVVLADAPDDEVGLVVDAMATFDLRAARRKRRAAGTSQA